MWVSSYTGVCLPVFPCISLCSFHPLLWENDSAQGPTGIPLLTDPKHSWRLTNADRQLDLGLFAPKLFLVGAQLPGLILPPLDYRLELGVLYPVTLRVSLYSLYEQVTTALIQFNEPMTVLIQFT